MGSDDFDGGGGEPKAGVGNWGNISGVNPESATTGAEAGDGGGNGSIAGSAEIVGKSFSDCEDREVLHDVMKRRIISMILVKFKEAINEVE